MKKSITVFSIVFFTVVSLAMILSLANCSSKEGIQARYKEVRELTTPGEVSAALEQGKNVRYLVKLELRQIRRGIDKIDLVKGWKDKKNRIEFEVPVDKQFYEEAFEGMLVLDKFRSGSAIIEGSFSNWRVSVSGKRIVIMNAEKSEQNQSEIK